MSRRAGNRSRRKGDDDWSAIISANYGWFNINIRELVHYRDLIGMLVKRNFTVMYKQTVLGPLWVIIQPLLTTLVFTVVFGNIAKLPTDGMPKFLFYMAGNIVWQLFSRCLQNTSKTFITNRGLFGKVYFPRMCMPISTVISQLINFGVQFVMFLAFVAYYALQPNPAVRPNGRLVLFTPLILIEVSMLGMGCGIIISALTTKYRDLQMLVGFGTHLWMYATPVTYSASLITERYPKLVALYMLNPVTPVLELFRAAYLGVQSLQPVYVVISGIMTIFIFALGVVLFNHTEKEFMDTV